MGRLGSGMRMRVSASFRIIPRPVGRLGLGLESGSEPHDVGRLGSGLRVGGLSPRIFFYIEPDLWFTRWCKRILQTVLCLLTPHAHHMWTDRLKSNINSGEYQGLKYLKMSTTHREGRWRGRRPRARHGGAKRRSAEGGWVWGGVP